MIWASDASGRTTYISPQWVELTGQPAAQAKAFGWMKAVHPNDRLITEQMFRKAIESPQEFWCLYRLRQHSGAYLWVVDGAMPSFGQVNGEFLGYLGSITEVDEPMPARPAGEFGQFKPPPPRESTKPLAALDMIADLVIVARMIAREAGENDLLETFDDTLRDIGARLGIPGAGRLAH